MTNDGIVARPAAVAESEPAESELALEPVLVDEQPAALPTVPATSAGGDWDVAALAVDCAVPSAPTAVPTTGAGSDESGLQVGAEAGAGVGVGAGVGAGAGGVGAGEGDGEGFEPEPPLGSNEDPPPEVVEMSPSGASGRELAENEGEEIEEFAKAPYELAAGVSVAAAVVAGAFDEVATGLEADARWAVAGGAVPWSVLAAVSAMSRTAQPNAMA